MTVIHASSTVASSYCGTGGSKPTQTRQSDQVKLLPSSLPGFYHQKSEIGGNKKGGLFTLFILLMEEILHQYVVYPIIYKALHIPVQDFFHQQYFQQHFAN